MCRPAVPAARLSGPQGTLAIAFVNVGPAAATATCDAACFAKAGVTAADLPLKVMDLWSGKSLPNLKALEMKTPSLAALGGIEMYKLSK